MTGYSVSATNDYGPWQLHRARWAGDAGLGDVFDQQRGRDIHDLAETTAFVARYIELNGAWGWTMWNGWGC